MTTLSAAPRAVMLSLLFASAVLAQQHEHASPANEKLGLVRFATSCSADAQPLFNRAVALLHSFEFGRAIEGFNATLETDRSCAMAEWGVALSRWGNPFAPGLRPPAPLQQGRDAVNRAKAIGMKTPRERAYLDAVSQLYDSFETIDQHTRMLAYRDAMAQVAGSDGSDAEASIFYALAIAAAAPPTDKTYADLLKAGAILESVIATHPDHPGLAHYIIHSYDVPPLADRALDAAQRYAKIAPSAPHALHMPSHTFTRVGKWQESIDTNIASAAAAKREGATAEELHTMDYRVYAYLQTTQDDAARGMLEALPEVKARFDPDAIGSAAPGSAGVFALAAIPARYALERGAWAEAAKLVPQPSRYLYPDALTYFAKALGAARTGDAPVARSAIEALRAIEDRLTEHKELYWAEQTEIQRRSASAWLALLEGRTAEALAEMRAAAALEDRTEKSAVTPGPLAPARELVGEMLLEMNQPAAALAEFEATLEKEPNRFRALFGAAKSASLAGDRHKAHTYAASLLKICERAGKPERPELVEARRLVNAQQPPPAPPDHMQHRFDDPERFAKSFDDPARDAWQMPDRVIGALGLRRDSLVADVGAGTGYFSVRVAKAVPAGTVFAVDVEHAMLEHVRKRATAEGLTNIVPVHATSASPNLPRPVDVVLIVDTYHHLPSRPTYFADLKTSLRSGGRIAIVDFRKDSPEGPPREFRFEADQIIGEMKQAGYELETRHDFLPRQHFLIFRMP